MRLIGRFPDQRQVSAVVDSLKNVGFDRKDMIISDLADSERFESVEEAAKDMIFIKSERDGLGEYEAFGEGMEEFRDKSGIIVSVKTPKHEGAKVRTIMEQSGAVEIVQD